MKNFTFGIILIVAIVALFAIWLGVVVGRMSQTEPPRYSVMYLANGDIYFGKLYWLTRPKLTDVWYMQRSVDARGGTQFSILPWKGTSWGPQDEIYLNPEQILFWSPLDPGGDFVKLLADPALRNQQFPNSKIPVDPGISPSL